MKVNNRVFDLIWLALIGVILFVGDFRHRNYTESTDGPDQKSVRSTDWAAMASGELWKAEATTQFKN